MKGLSQRPSQDAEKEIIRLRKKRDEWQGRLERAENPGRSKPSGDTSSSKGKGIRGKGSKGRKGTRSSDRIRGSPPAASSVPDPSPNTGTVRRSNLRPPAATRTAGRGYADPPDWDSKSQKARSNFHLLASKANPATQSLTLPGMTPPRPPGTIPITRTADRPAVKPAGSPTSFSEAVTDPTEPYPSLSPPQDPEKHLSQTPVYRRDSTPRPVTQSQPQKTETSDGAKASKGESRVSPTPSASKTTQSKPRGSKRVATEELPLSQRSFQLFMKARQQVTMAHIVDPYDVAHDNFVRETEEAAERLRVRATGSTHPGDKDPQFCDDALGYVTAYNRHLAERRSALSAMEEAHRHSSILALQAVSSRFANMVAIFRKQQEQLKKYELVLNAERQKTKEAKAQTERLKSLHLEQTKDLKRAKANSSSLSNTVVSKNLKLKKWQRSYRLLEQEVADLHAERLERGSVDPERMALAPPIRVHPHAPPQPTTDEEDDEEDLGEPIPLLTASQIFAIDQSRGLISSEASERSNRQAMATASTADVSQVSPTPWGSEASVEVSSADRMKAMEDKLAALMAVAAIPPPPPMPPTQPPYGAGYIPMRFASPPLTDPATKPPFLQGSIWDVASRTDRVLPSQLPAGTVIRPVTSSPRTATMVRPVPTLQLKPDGSWIGRDPTKFQPTEQPSGQTGSGTSPPLDLSKSGEDALLEQVEAMEIEVPEAEVISSDDGTTVEVASTLSTATQHTAGTEEVSDTTLLTSPTQSDVEVVLGDPSEPPTVTLVERPASPLLFQPPETEGEGEVPPST